MRVLTPVPPSFLKYSCVFEMELPVWGILDYAAGGDEDEWKSGVGCRIYNGAKATVTKVQREVAIYDMFVAGKSFPRVRKIYYISSL